MELRAYKKPTISLFDEIFGDFFNVSVVDSMGIKTPIHDVIENDKEYIVEILLAGVLKENINVDVEKDVLTIKAERKLNKDLKYNRQQTYFGKYERSFVLPDDVDTENINVVLADGILTITIPKLVGDIKSGKKSIEIK